MDGALVRHLIRSLLGDLNMIWDQNDWECNVMIADYDRMAKKPKKTISKTLGCPDWRFWTVEGLRLMDIERDTVIVVIETHKNLTALKGNLTIDFIIYSLCLFIT